MQLLLTSRRTTTTRLPRVPLSNATLRKARPRPLLPSIPSLVAEAAAILVQETLSTVSSSEAEAIPSIRRVQRRAATTTSSTNSSTTDSSLGAPRTDRLRRRSLLHPHATQAFELGHRQRPRIQLRATLTIRTRKRVETRATTRLPPSLRHLSTRTRDNPKVIQQSRHFRRARK